MRRRIEIGVDGESHNQNEDEQKSASVPGEEFFEVGHGLAAAFRREPVFLVREIDPCWRGIGDGARREKFDHGRERNHHGVNREKGLLAHPAVRSAGRSEVGSDCLRKLREREHALCDSRQNNRGENASRQARAGFSAHGLLGVHSSAARVVHTNSVRIRRGERNVHLAAVPLKQTCEEPLSRKGCAIEIARSSATLGSPRSLRCHSIRSERLPN